MAKRNFPTGGAVPIDPGSRDRRVMLQELTEAAGDTGFPVESWEDLGEVWMFREVVRGSERYAAGQLTSPSMVRWEMGYRSDMDPERHDVSKKRRLVYAERIYDIVDGSVIGRREGIELVTIDGKRAEEA